MRVIALEIQPFGLLKLDQRRSNYYECSRKLYMKLYRRSPHTLSMPQEAGPVDRALR